MMPQIERSPPAPDEAKNTAAHPPEAPERVVELPLTELYPFKDHPFHVVDDAHMLSTAQTSRTMAFLFQSLCGPEQKVDMRSSPGIGGSGLVR